MIPLAVVWAVAWLYVFARYPWLPFALALPFAWAVRRWLRSLN